MIMERKIGEIFEYNGEWYQCLEGTGCSKCCFNSDKSICLAENPYCACRTDHKEVIYKKLEKVGEPYVSYGKLRQRYKLFVPLTVTNEMLDKDISCDEVMNTVDIAIKQNQEEYKEENLTLKPFDFEAAKAGKPVCTRDGRKGRIICFDRNDLYPIVALIECEDGKEMVGAYSKEGQTEIYEIKGTDLMMLSEKKEGWVNVYKDFVYDTKDEALIVRSEIRGYIDTIKISWEE